MKFKYTHISLIIPFSVFIFAGISYGAESNDFILIDSEFSGSQSLGQNINEDSEEAQLIDIQHLGESNNFIESNSYCGNNQIEGNEKCDGSNFNGKTCNSFGFSGGSLVCHSSCQEIITNNCITTTHTPTPTMVISSGGTGGNGGSGGGSGGGNGGGGYIPNATTTPITTPAPTETPIETPTEPMHSSAPTISPTATVSPETSPTPTSILHTNAPTAPPTNKPIIRQTEKPQIQQIINTEENMGSIIEITKDDIEKSNNNKKEEIIKDINENKLFIPTFNPEIQYINSQFKNSASEEINRNKQKDISCWIWLLLAFLLGFFTRHILGYFFDKKQQNIEKIE